MLPTPLKEGAGFKVLSHEVSRDLNPSASGLVIDQTIETRSIATAQGGSNTLPSVLFGVLPNGLQSDFTPEVGSNPDMISGQIATPALQMLEPILETADEFLPHLRDALTPGPTTFTTGTLNRPTFGKTAAPIVSQIVGVVRVGGSGEFEVALSPAELGRVKLSLKPEGASILVHIAAEREETLMLLRRHSDDLAHEFTEQGFTQVSIEFGFSAENSDRDETDPNTAPKTVGEINLGNVSQAGTVWNSQGLNIKI